MGTIMTPEQMKELAARIDNLALGFGDINEAADLIRQMAEQEPVAWADPEWFLDRVFNEDAFCPHAVDGWTALYAAPPAPQPSRSKRLADAGFTRRDTRIECDECGKKVTPQFLPIHECAPQPARVPMTSEQIRQARNEIVDPSFLDGVIVAECYHGIRSEE
jgi:hypothetical protein